MKKAIVLLLLAALWIVQTVIIRSTTLFAGSADLLLLVVLAWVLQPGTGRTGWLLAFLVALLAELTSAMPTGIYFFFYFFAATLAFVARRYLWQSGFFAMLLLVVLSTLTGYSVFYVVLWAVRGLLVPIREVLAQIIFPAVFLNLLWAFPLFYAVRDLAEWAYPEGE